METFNAKAAGTGNWENMSVEGVIPENANPQKLAIKVTLRAHGRQARVCR